MIIILSLQLTVSVMIFGAGLSSVLPVVFSTYVTPLIEGFRELVENNDAENGTVILRILDGASETIGIVLVGLPGELMHLLINCTPKLTHIYKCLSRNDFFNVLFSIAFLCISPLVSMVFCLCLLVNMVATVRCVTLLHYNRLQCIVFLHCCYTCIIICNTYKYTYMYRHIILPSLLMQ